MSEIVVITRGLHEAKNNICRYKARPLAHLLLLSPHYLLGGDKGKWWLSSANDFYILHRQRLTSWRLSTAPHPSYCSLPLSLSSPSILSLPFPCLSIDDRSRELVSSPPQGLSFAMREASRAVSIGKIYNLLCLKWPGIVMSSISEPHPPSHEYMFMLSALLTPM